MKEINKKVKKMDFWDVGFMKWGVVAAVLFLITVWPGLHDLVMKVHWGWYLGAMVLFMIRPLTKFFS